MPIRRRCCPGIDTGGVQDLIDDVGLLRPGCRLQRHGFGDGVELIALLALKDRALELLSAHQLPLFVLSRTFEFDVNVLGVGQVALSAGEPVWV
jgi:hypothetical protein